jgi:hypothetical protein
LLDGQTRHGDGSTVRFGHDANTIRHSLQIQR